VADEFGTMAADGLARTLTCTEKEEQNPFKTTPSARRVPGKRAGPPQRHEFVPTIFHRQFSASNPPVLRIWLGDP
jgi:maltose-binding protein MalE